MRKQYLAVAAKPKLAIESIDSVLMGRALLSLEEEIVALAEASDLQAEIDTGLSEATRVEDVSDNVMDVADIVEPIEAVTPQQAALIDTAAEMAVAGTDGEPEQVLPAMEHYIGKRIAVEDLRQRAKDIWEQIRKYVMELWGKIKAFFSKIFSAMPRQLARIKALRELIAAKKKAGGEPAQPKISILVGHGPISYPGHQVQDAKELNGGLTGLKKLGDYVFDGYAKNVKKQGEVIAGELKKFDPKSPAESLKVVRGQLSSVNFNSTPPTPQGGYMGSFGLHVARIDQKKAQELSDAQVINALRHTGVTLVTSKAHGISARIGDKLFTTMTFGEMESTLTLVEGLIKDILSYETGANYKAYETVRAELIAGGEAAQAAMAKLPDAGEATKTERAFATDVMKSLMNFNTTFASWSTKLPGEYIKRSLGATRVALVLVEKSLSQYGSAAAPTKPA